MESKIQMSLIQANTKNVLVAVVFINQHVLMINLVNLSNHTSWPILESKCMHTIFQKKGENMLEKGKKGKILENLSKNIQNSKIF